MPAQGRPRSDIHPVILSGGAGTRLWPLSTTDHPKQLLALTGADSLLQTTARRVERLGLAPLTVVCHRDHRDRVVAQLRELGGPEPRVVIEPEARNTAAAAIAASLMIEAADPGASALILPSDHVVADEDAFARAVATAASAAALGRIAMLGAPPDRPETGYGYIRVGDALEGAPGAFAIAQFVEKPDAATAAAYVERGGFLWNAGIVLARARLLIEEADRLAPELAEACRAAVARARREGGRIELDAEAFARAPRVSFDVAILERTALGAVAPARIGWSDVGSWAALWELAARDADGNAVLGAAVALDAHNCYLRSEGPRVAVLGCDDLVVVATGDAVLVAPRARTQEIKALAAEVERLRETDPEAR